MGQEQKPFEIKDRNWEQVQSMTIREIAAYCDDANAEIRRLQEVVSGLERDTADLHLESTNLQQQLADAPTWGEWKDATVENLSKADTGFYEFEDRIDGSTKLIRHDGQDAGNWAWVDELSENNNEGIEACFVKFRRLNYEPQPAQNKGTIEMNNGIPRRNRIDLYTPAEHAIRAAILAVEDAGCHPFLTDAVGLLGHAQNKVADFIELKPARVVEKTYKSINSTFERTVAQMADEFPDLVLGMVAKDFLELQEKHAAAQAELRELKGEQ